jgi:hypothetical protein
MALGAPGATYCALVIREVGMLIAAGLVLGLPTGLAAARLIRSRRTHVRPLGRRLLSRYARCGPVSRRQDVDPMRALRWE